MNGQPFHKSVLRVIAKADRGEMTILAQLILETVIPGGHDTIIEAWRARKEILNLNTIKFGVVAHVEEQKREAEAKAAASKSPMALSANAS